MGLDFSKVKNLFVEQVDNKTTGQPSPGAKPVTQASAPAQAQPEVETEVDQIIFQSLIKAIESNNLPGEDYLEFISALKAMQNIALDENLKIQTVMATLSTKGLTLARIVESADYYIKILDSEKQKFYDALHTEKAEKISKKETEINKLEQENKAKAEQIAKLTVEINKNAEVVKKVKEEISNSTQKIQTTEVRFLKTMEAVVNQIQGNVEKIKKIK